MATPDTVVRNPQEAERLNRLITNLLDVSRIEAGAFKVHKCVVTGVVRRLDSLSFLCYIPAKRE